MTATKPGLIITKDWLQLDAKFEHGYACVFRPARSVEDIVRR
jgi:hypothetical protein